MPLYIDFQADNACRSEKSAYECHFNQYVLKPNTHYLEKIIHYLEKIIHYLKKITHYLEKIIHYLEKITHHLQKIIHYLEKIIHYLEKIIHWSGAETYIIFSNTQAFFLKQAVSGAKYTDKFMKYTHSIFIDLRTLNDLEKLDLLHEQGDGMRSFILVLINAIISNYSIVFIDEPEAFLHPPQAQLLGKILSKDLPLERQLFLATHSEDFLKDCFNKLF